MNRTAVTTSYESSSSNRHALQTSGTAAAFAAITLLPFGFATSPPPLKDLQVINRTTASASGQVTYSGMDPLRSSDDSLATLTRLFRHSVRRNRLDSLVGQNSPFFRAAFSALDLMKHIDCPEPLINSTGESVLFEFVVNESRISLDFYDSGEIVHLRKTPGRNVFVEEAAVGDLTKIVSQISEEYAQNGV